MHASNDMNLDDKEKRGMHAVSIGSVAELKDQIGAAKTTPRSHQKFKDIGPVN